ncbi:hypothetical protein ARMSODRAFT_946462 [Armillaria solidipes]|uniref:Uncharacterized protein n=1 Tax=Armillaria solidipes TaxID=1076256 RepID=A0A2H3C3G3_9AGAR|nr:hypothetical protein ARMSODRAFT_946462 [Armillaria solidipes]
MAMASLTSLSSIRLLHWPFKLTGASALISVARFDCDTCAQIRRYAILVRICGYANVEAMIDPNVERTGRGLYNVWCTSCQIPVYEQGRRQRRQHPPQVPSQSTTRVSSICQTSVLVWLALTTGVGRPRCGRCGWWRRRLNDD